MSGTTRPWIRPTMTTLTRGKPTERVLETCKGTTSSGSFDENLACYEADYCDKCYENAFS